jgi:FHA domain
VQTTTTNRDVMRLKRRAEGADPAQLAGTFVDVGTLLTRVSSSDHQIIYGRRGTGKTHALLYLDSAVRERGEVAIYVDLQTLGSTGGIYADSDVPVAEAGTRLLVDALTQIHDGLVDRMLFEAERREVTPSLRLLDRLADEITEVSVTGEEERRVKTARASATDASAGLDAGLSLPGPRIGARASRTKQNSELAEVETVSKGQVRHRVHFGTVRQTVEKLVATLPGGHLWVLVDEWSQVPSRLQPLLADLLRRCLFSVRGVSVKIAAIEARSTFEIDAGTDGQVGIEVGADAAADVDLDDYMVFGHDEEMAIEFFGQLFQKHVAAIAAEEGRASTYPTVEAFVDRAFVNPGVFGELVQAAEGVPRDAINIAVQAAQKANERKIALADVRSAARTWYLRDKEKAVESKPEARALLHWIIDTVIGERHLRGFLLEQDTPYPLIRWLVDARVLHVVKRGLSAPDQPGVRFDAYAIDYGCYVDLLATHRAPKGLLRAGVDAANEVNVPPDQYELSRNAILNLEDFADRRLPIRARHAEIRWLPATDVPGELGDVLNEEGAYLLADAGEHVAAIPLTRDCITLGRGMDVDIRLIDPSVDTRHASIFPRKGGAKVSTERQSYVYVNGAKRQHANLKHGDDLRIGKFSFDVVVVVAVVESSRR